MRISLYILGLLTWGTVAAVPTDSVTVTGHISGIADNGRKSLIVNECDFSQKSVRAFVDVDSTGTFNTKIPYSSAHTFTIVYNREFVYAYAEPGDSIHIEIDASVSPVVFHLSGDHASLNEEYSHARKAISNIYYNLRLPSPDTPLSVYMPEFKAAVNNTQKTIDEYVTTNRLSDEAAEMLRTENLFTLANAAIDYTGANKDEQLAFFTDSIFDIYNENNARLMIFPYHLGALCVNFPDIVKSAPEGRIRDLMFVALADDTVPHRGDFADSAYFDRVFGSSASAIDLSGIRQSDILVYRDGTVSSIENVEPVEWLRKAYPGKPVYLDVSATWCGPCRASLSESEDIRAHFKNKDVVFAVLWLKSEQKQWAELAPAVTNAVHIFINDDEMADAIISRLNLQGFPSSYFIDRSGNITKDNVPPFHSHALYDYLNAALK
ncbi:MAG: TlpA family protein disulfide reductase [Paramuribaculum sp.]|nr:TlpA family protein disulfide reductase [Paramuribaculum sp.]